MASAGQRQEHSRTTASPPHHNMLASTVKSSARTENARRSEQAGEERPCTDYARVAPTTQRMRLSASKMRRSARRQRPEPREWPARPHGDVRARIRLATFEQAMIKQRPEAQENGERFERPK